MARQRNKVFISIGGTAFCASAPVAGIGMANHLDKQVADTILQAQTALQQVTEAELQVMKDNVLVMKVMLAVAITVFGIMCCVGAGIYTHQQRKKQAEPSLIPAKSAYGFIIGTAITTFAISMLVASCIDTASLPVEPIGIAAGVLAGVGLVMFIADLIANRDRPAERIT